MCCCFSVGSSGTRRIPALLRFHLCCSRQASGFFRQTCLRRQHMTSPPKPSKSRGLPKTKFRITPSRGMFRARRASAFAFIPAHFRASIWRIGMRASCSSSPPRISRFSRTHVDIRQALHSRVMQKRSHGSRRLNKFANASWAPRGNLRG